MYITAMVRIRPETALEIFNKRKINDLILGKKKEKTIAFSKVLKLPFLFWERNKKFLGQSTSNDIPIWNKNSLF